MKTKKDGAVLLMVVLILGMTASFILLHMTITHIDETKKIGEYKKQVEIRYDTP